MFSVKWVASTRNSTTVVLREGFRPRIDPGVPMDIVKVTVAYDDEVSRFRGLHDHRVQNIR
jgi:hypothetical protein